VILTKAQEESMGVDIRFWICYNSFDKEELFKNKYDQQSSGRGLAMLNPCISFIQRVEN
jgi:hypothetical protein